MKSYCPRHTKSSHHHSFSPPGTPIKRGMSASPRGAFAPAAPVYYELVAPGDAVRKLKIEENVASAVYEFWKLKRKV